MEQKKTCQVIIARLLVVGLIFILPMARGQGQAYAASEARNLIGTWELVSWKHQKKDGSTSYPMGETPVGLLIYDGMGNFSLQIMDDFRPTFEAGYDQTSLEELKSVYKTYSAMFGHYTIDTSAKTIDIQVRAITNPSYLSSELTRYYELRGDQLTLSLDKKRLNNTLWKRVKN